MLRRVSDAPAGRAISVGGISAVDESTDGKSAADDSGWFANAAQRLLPDKPGTILHLTTGLGDERLCQRYAAGTVRPPAYFFRALLRTDQGGLWLDAAMDGCEARWWTELKRDREHAAKFRTWVRNLLRDIDIQ